MGKASSSLRMETLYGPKPANAPKPMQNPSPNNVFSEALTALGNFGRDATSRMQEAERQDAAYEARTGPKPSWYTTSYGKMRASQKDQINIFEMQTAQFEAMKEADRREAGEKFYDAARGIITPYECHRDNKWQRGKCMPGYGEPLNGYELIKKLLEDYSTLYKSFGMKFDGINEPSKINGRTALHGACEVGDEAMLSWLCSENFGEQTPLVSVNVKDKDGLTAFDVAEELGHTGCVEFLRNHGGKPGAEIPEIPNHRCTIS
eukprot:gnl/MRDRNA2_/MRDRNA2_154666_c0_seq1.p1 gnl/MRDRNA2_/MRDRNA2_154666_c0~~gnl/MRDRNA2_/MRDRNA2_154666_c0_seq1.p1  ORF type:complete len:262 (-),score=49.03 gnl/MRDRNA2_/MRDRNA2_154666_c0_seq1:160-945(-)